MFGVLTDGKQYYNTIYKLYVVWTISKVGARKTRAKQLNVSCKELNSYLRCVLAVSMAKARTCRTTSDHGRVYI